MFAYQPQMFTPQHTNNWNQDSMIPTHCPIQYYQQMQEPMCIAPLPTTAHKKSASPVPEAARTITISDDEEVMDVSFEEPPSAFKTVITTPGNRSYGFVRQLGAGTFGEAFEVYSFQDDCYYAMKVQETATEMQTKRADREVRMMQKLQESLPFSEYITHAVDCFDLDGSKCIVMEKLDIDLCNFVKRLESRDLHMKYVKTVAYRLLSAIADLHWAGFIHGDLKLENAMFVDRKGEDPWRLKLIDFGLMQTTERVRSKMQGKQFGTAHYWPPEMFVGLPLDEKVDIWAVGLMIFEMYTGRRMFTKATKSSTFGNICRIVGFPSNMEQGMRVGEFFYPEGNSKIGFEWRHTVDLSFSDCWYQPIGFADLHKCINRSSQSEDGDVPITRDDVMFKDMIEKLLHRNSYERISARDALQHEFFK